MSSVLIPVDGVGLNGLRSKVPAICGTKSDLVPLPDEVAVAIAIIQLLGELRSVGLSSLKARCRRFSPCFLRCELLFDRAFTESFFVNYTRLLLIQQIAVIHY